MLLSSLIEHEASSAMAAMKREIFLIIVCKLVFRNWLNFSGCKLVKKKSIAV